MAVDWLESTVCERTGTRIYSLNKIREKYEVREICEDAWLVLNPKEEYWLSFAVLEFYSSELDGANITAQLIFHGDGAHGALRECRHTYWGEDGYLFYVHGGRVSAAFKALAEFFNDMVAK